jgi:hypothetical protein
MSILIPSSTSIQTESACKIQSIFNDTVYKIKQLFVKTAEKNNTGVSESVIEPGQHSDEKKGPTTGVIYDVGPVEIIPILQTFLLDIQIYNTQMFNGMVNSVSAQPLLLKEDLVQPQVTAKWQSTMDTSNTALLQGLIMEDVTNEKPKWPMERERVKDWDSHVHQQSKPPSYSIANKETRQHWGSRSPISIPNNFGKYSNSTNMHNSPISGVPTSNYDDFLAHYTKEYANYNSTYVADSSDGENDETWKSLSEYVESNGTKTTKPGHVDTPSSDTQCCARLSKFMKYHIIDFPVDFMDSYPPDTYIEGGNVFGNPCYNKVSKQNVAAGIYFCKEHQFDAGVEDIRQPRPDTNHDRTHLNDDVDIVFSKSGYTNGNCNSTNDASHIDEGFDYYNDCPRVYSGFTEGHQCCARLNKYRKYDITQEPDGFLETYPPGVYMDNGFVYGTACQNMYSDESAKAGIKYCVFHQSDPYVENICEPRGVLNRPSRSTKSGSEEADMLGLTETNSNSRNKGDNTKTTYEWDKYNTDFNYIC